MFDTTILGLDPGAPHRKKRLDRRLVRKGWDPAVVALMPAPPAWYHPPPQQQVWRTAYKAFVELNQLPEDERRVAISQIATRLERTCPCCGQLITDTP